MKFNGEADVRDKQKNPSKTMMVKILEGLSYLLVDNYKSAASKLTSVSIVDDSLMTSLITPSDLAYYITITSLASLNRKDLKTMVMQSA
jgi:hypothetical protein